MKRRILAPNSTQEELFCETHLTRLEKRRRGGISVYQTSELLSHSYWKNVGIQRAASAKPALGKVLLPQPSQTRRRPRYAFLASKALSLKRHCSYESQYVEQVVYESAEHACYFSSCRCTLLPHFFLLGKYQPKCCCSPLSSFQKMLRCRSGRSGQLASATTT